MNDTKKTSRDTLGVSCLLMLITWLGMGYLNAKPASLCDKAVAHYAKKDLGGREIAKLFEQAAETGDIRARMWIARLRFKGRASMVPSPIKAQREARELMGEIRKLAEKDDRESQFLLGSSYNEGLGVKQDFKLASRWFGKAAKAGHLIAANNLGVMYEWGIGVDPDIEQARTLYAQAAEGGHRMAKNKLRENQDTHPDKSGKRKKLSENPLARVVGMKVETGIAFLVAKKLISQPKGFDPVVLRSQNQYLFRKDGLLLFFHEETRRIVTVNAYAGGVRNCRQFRGEIPFELDWADTSQAVTRKMGLPTDSGNVPNDQAYGMAYRIGNVHFSVMFEYEGDRKIKIWRVAERWADRPTEE